MLFQRIFTVLLAGCLGAGVSVAQAAASPAVQAAASPAVKVEGLSGVVRILPNVERHETTVVLTMNYASTSVTNQIVFHIQEASDNVPAPWNGPAHVLVADGLLAIVPRDQSPKLLFKFAELQRPASLASLALNEYAVYGIARFGEKTALNQSQINELATTGRFRTSRQ